MKKFDLLKVLGITFLIVALISWVIPAGEFSTGAYKSIGSTDAVGLYDIFRTPAIAIATFIQYGVLFLAIGGFYGVLNKTGVYSKLVENITKKWNKSNKNFLIITIVTFILLTSLIGFPNMIFILVPFFVAILLKLGFNKMTALASTVGSILVGQIGTTFGFSVWGFLKVIFDLNMTTLIIERIILLVILAVLFIMMVIKSEKPKEIKKLKKDKKEIEEKKETSKIDIPLYDTKETKKSIIPLAIISCLMLIVLVLGLYNWFYAFNIDVFKNLNETIMSYEFNDYPLFANILGNVSELGAWGNYDIVVVLVIASLIIGWIYNVKFNDIIDGFKKGCKEMLKPALYAMLASVIFALFLNMPYGNFLNTIVDKIIPDGEKFSFVGTIGSVLVTSFAYNDFYTLIENFGGVIPSTKSSLIPNIAFIFQTMYGLVMLIAPTSIYLLAGLSYLEVPYKDWLKYIWKFILIAFAIVVIITFITVAFII